VFHIRGLNNKPKSLGNLRAPASSLSWLKLWHTLSWTSFPNSRLEQSSFSGQPDPTSTQPSPGLRPLSLSHPSPIPLPSLCPCHSLSISFDFAKAHYSTCICTRPHQQQHLQNSYLHVLCVSRFRVPTASQLSKKSRPWFLKGIFLKIIGLCRCDSAVDGNGDGTPRKRSRNKTDSFRDVIV
jgi:hypothetical protein